MLQQRLQQLIKQPWINKVFAYLDDTSGNNWKIQINDITVKNITPNLKPDILELLRLHLDEEKDKLENIEILLLEKRKELLKLKKLIKIIDKSIQYKENHNGHLNKSIKYAIRRGFIIDEYGKNICHTFYQQIKDIDIFDGNVDLLFNPYTSLINIIEIYQQVDTQVIIDFSFYWNNGLMVRSNNLIIFGNSQDKDLNKLIIEKGEGKGNNNLLHQIIKRLCIFNYLGDVMTLPRKLTIYWIDYKKEVMTIKDDKDRLFTSSEINTGVTNGVEIIITRKEECLKTVLHECCHLYDWDFKVIPKELNKWFLSIFPITTTLTDYKNQPTLNLFEAYTEWLASILEIIFRNYPEGGVNIVLEKITQQIIYTSQKCWQILEISNCQSVGQFLKSYTTYKRVSNSSGKCQIHQSTNVFSYFVLKLFLYWRCDLLLSCLDDNGSFIESKNNFNMIKIITEKCVRSKSLLDFMMDNIKKGDTNTSLKMVKY